MKVYLQKLAFFGVIAVMTPGCGQNRKVEAPPGPAKAGAKTYRMTGVVRRVDAKDGVVTIRHDDIPGFMKSMTMPFNVADKKLLDDVQPGDEVEGTLRVEGETSKLTDLVVTRPAPAAPLSLDLGGGPPRLTPKPAVLEPGQPVPDFTVTTQDGRPLKLSDLRGRVVVLTFIYTRCPLPDFCPALDKKFRELADALQLFPARAERVRLLSVSFDPEHDTPEVLRKHATIQGARPPLWQFAVASHDELRRVAGPLGLAYGPTPKEIIHNRTVAVIAPDGTLARLLVGSEGAEWKPSDVLKTIYALISDFRK